MECLNPSSIYLLLSTVALAANALRTRYFQDAATGSILCTLTESPPHLQTSSDGSYAAIHCETRQDANETIGIPSLHEALYGRFYRAWSSSGRSCLLRVLDAHTRCSHIFVRINSPPAVTNFTTLTLCTRRTNNPSCLDIDLVFEEPTTASPVTCVSSPTSQQLENNATDTGDDNSTTVSMVTPTQSETRTSSSTTSTNDPSVGGNRDSVSIGELTQHAGFVTVMVLSITFVTVLSVMACVLVTTCWHFKKKMRPHPADKDPATQP